MADDLTRWVALLRGVNVGGGNKVPMAALRELATGLGWRDVRSYIASGNLVFSAPDGRLAEDLGDAMRQQMGVDVPNLVLSGEALRLALASCPYPPDAGKAVHGFFCAAPPVIDATRRDALAVASERLEVRDHVVWMYAPDGFGRSKLAAKIDKVITGTEFTARNLNTIRKLVEMLDG